MIVSDLFMIVSDLFMIVGDLFMIVSDLFMIVGDLFMIVGDLFMIVSGNSNICNRQAPKETKNFTHVVLWLIVLVQRCCMMFI